MKKSDLTETMVCFSGKAVYLSEEIKRSNLWNEDLNCFDSGFNITAVYDLKDAKPIWKRQEPIVLNEREKAILVAYGYCKWITRDSNDELLIYSDKPKKCASYWVTSSEREYYIPSDLFQFVQWKDKEPTSLDELRGLK